MNMTTNRTKDIIEDLMQVFGLTKQEAEVYYVCLQFSRPTPRKIEKETGITRSAIYKYFDKLKALGLLIEKRTKNNKRYFMTAPVKDAVNKVVLAKEEELAKLKKNSELIEKKITDLQTQPSDAPFYVSEGLMSFYQLLKSILTDKSSTYWIGSANMLESLFTQDNSFLKRKFSFERFGRKDMADKGVIIGDKPDTVYYKNDSNRSYKQIKLNNAPDAFLAISDKHFGAATYHNGKLIFFSTTDKNLIKLFEIIFKKLWGCVK